MQQLRMILMLLACSIAFTGCFEMVEEVNHNSKTGDGNYKFVMDMSGMKMMFEMAAAMDTTGQMNMDTLSALSKEFVTKVDGLSGISNVKEVSDLENFKFGVSFDYKSLAALNVAAGQLFEDGQISSGGGEAFFKGKKKKFERLDAKGFGGMMDQMMGGMGGGEAEEMEMASQFLKDVSYTMIYTFDKKVKKMSNSQATLSGDKKTVTLKYFMFDEERGGANGTVENIIKLKGGWF